MSGSMRTVTDRTIGRLRERGYEVVDHRGRLAPNPRGYRYGPLAGGLSGVRYLIHHWTGDSFTRQSLRTITGNPDYPADVITADLSLDDEMDLVHWYNAYHQGNDGGIWPGLAYGVLVFPSGRIHWAWDIGTLTYHAYEANAVSFASCCPNANGAQPTRQQLGALSAVWDLLCFETPEIPAGRNQLYGHCEATFLDWRNSTACPGTFLPAVQEYRTSGRLALAPVVDPNAYEDPVTHYWVINTPEAPILTYWRAGGGVEAYGHPRGPMIQRPDGVYEQPFENILIESWRDGWGPYPGPHVRLGGLGQRYFDALKQIAELQDQIAKRDEKLAMLQEKISGRIEEPS